MGRKSFGIETLHGYTIEDLVELKNSTNSKYSRLTLTIVTMRYYGQSNADITAATGLSKPSIVKYIKEWNAQGIESTKDNRGGSENKLEPEMVDDLIYVATNKSPSDFEFTCHNWTCELLSLYIEQTYGIKVSGQTIRVTLIANRLSYKRAQPKPTKANKVEQEALSALVGLT